MSKWAGALTPEQFVEKWSKAQLSERAASQEHFIDLCHLLGQPTPAQADATGADYCFEKHVKVVGAASKGSKGDYGFVDVWWRNRFAWEYKGKGKHKTLDEAYAQVYQYRDALDNPPLSVVCDIRTTEIRAHFPKYPTVKTVVRLEEIPGRLEVLRRVFTNPDSFRPDKTREQLTGDLARTFGDLADNLLSRSRAVAPTLWHGAGDPVAHFLMKVMFCLFAEDVGLLPDRLFTRLVDGCIFEPQEFQPRCAELFDKMKSGGRFGNDRIPYFNGGLFDDEPPMALTDGELRSLAAAAEKGWAAVEPSIFGTLFERILDPKKRAQIGAHYTSREDINLVVEPVVMAPLRRKWAVAQEAVAPQLQALTAEKDPKKRDVLSGPVRATLDAFRRYLGTQRILDPACGSGNFLYVTLQQLLDLDDEIVRFAARYDVALNPLPYVTTKQLHGIEINPYAAELAQVVVWLGYLQWLAEHNVDNPKRPILDKLTTIENRDAILDLSSPALPVPAQWPEADFIIGNPPFLGCRHFRESGLADAYVSALHRAYELPRTSDLCGYWFERARQAINAFPQSRVGLLATQAIRNVDNREVLRRIQNDASIFWAWANRRWVLDGAAVRVAMVGFDGGNEQSRELDGRAAEAINFDLSSGTDVASSQPLRENANIAFMGDTKGGPFDLDFSEGRQLLAMPNPNGRPNADVVRPWINGEDVTKRPRGDFIIDFGVEATLAQASGYAEPFARVEERVKPERLKNRRATYAENWWLHVEPRPAMREALPPARFFVTPRVSKYRVFAWCPRSVLADSRVFIFARSDDFLFGVVHSSIHEVWSLRMGARHGDGDEGGRPAYNATTCFETFALPLISRDGADSTLGNRIAAAAKALNEQRERWLNPPEWVEPLAAKVDAADDFADVPADARPLVRQSAIMAAAAKDARLKKRTLTNLYNERPTWLRLAHEQLDRAVLAAYAAVDPAGEWAEEWAAVWVDTGAGQPLPDGHALIARRAEVDQRVLANLLRLNHARATGGDADSPADAPRKPRRGKTAAPAPDPADSGAAASRAV